MNKFRHSSTASCPNSETELLLKRLTRDAELRESFGRYALIGEACRGAKSAHLTRGLVCAGQSRDQRRGCGRRRSGFAAGRTALVAADGGRDGRRERRRYRGFCAPAACQYPDPRLAAANTVTRSMAPAGGAPLAKSREPVSYTTPALNSELPTAFPAARLTNYVFAHSKYQSLLGQRDVLSDLIDPTPKSLRRLRPKNRAVTRR